MNNPIPKSRLFGLAASILVIGVGCLCLPSTLLTTPTPTQPAAPTDSLPPTPAPTVTLAATEPPAVTPLPLPPTPPQSAVSLNAEGPWLLIESDSGLWAMNPDGSGLTQLTEVDYWHGNLRAAIQPDGKQVAFISPGDFGFHHMALNLLMLPSGKTVKVTDLTSAQTEAYADSGPGDPGFEALRAIGEQRSLAWSEDGSKLAFVGAMDGPSADAYIYDERLYKIFRVSQDADQDFSLSWSPDGQHLLYFEALGFGTGAGYSMKAAWLANGDGSNTTLLYNAGSGGEEIRGWLNDSTVLLDSWNIVCGPSKLRLYDVISGQQTMLSEDCITSAVASGWSQAAMYSNDSGLYMLTNDNRTPAQVSTVANIQLDPYLTTDHTFIGRSQGGHIATWGTGDFSHQESPVTAAAGTNLPFDETDVAEWGAIWGWTSQNPNQPGAWISGPGIDIGQIYTGAARFPAWTPHNNLLFFAVSPTGGYDLYLTTFDSHYTDLQPVNHVDLKIYQVVWLGPW